MSNLEKFAEGIDAIILEQGEPHAGAYAGAQALTDYFRHGIVSSGLSFVNPQVIEMIEIFSQRIPNFFPTLLFERCPDEVSTINPEGVEWNFFLDPRKETFTAYDTCFKTLDSDARIRDKALAKDILNIGNSVGVIRGASHWPLVHYLGTGPDIHVFLPFQDYPVTHAIKQSFALRTQTTTLEMSYACFFELYLARILQEVLSRRESVLAATLLTAAGASEHVLRIAQKGSYSQSHQLERIINGLDGFLNKHLNLVCDQVQNRSGAYRTLEFALEHPFYLPGAMNPSTDFDY